MVSAETGIRTSDMSPRPLSQIGLSCRTNPVHILVNLVLRNQRFFFGAELLMGLLDCVEFIQVDERFVGPVFLQPLVFFPLLASRGVSLFSNSSSLESG